MSHIIQYSKGRVSHTQGLHLSLKGEKDTVHIADLTGGGNANNADSAGACRVVPVELIPELISKLKLLWKEAGSPRKTQQAPVIVSPVYHMTDANDFINLLRDEGFRSAAGIKSVYVRQGTSKTIVDVTYNTNSPLLAEHGAMNPTFTYNGGRPQKLGKFCRMPIEKLVEAISTNPPQWDCFQQSHGAYILAGTLVTAIKNYRLGKG